MASRQTRPSLGGRMVLLYSVCRSDVGAQTYECTTLDAVDAQGATFVRDP
jgi:hypothetical protein